MRIPNFAQLEKKIGITFEDKGLLKRALTHGSAAEARNALNSYQRLEFLGDRVLGLAMAEILYKNHPKALEGELSRRLTSLVRKEACTQVGRDLELGQYFILGMGEAQSGGRDKATILADVVEALLGAIFLEFGFEVVRDCVEKWWQQQLKQGIQPLRDPKTVLQEWAHSEGYSNPQYRTKDRTGPDHSPIFTIMVSLQKQGETFSADGKGASKRTAEQAAAEALKNKLSQNSDEVAT